jgi:ribosomal protein L11 methyltransferase
LNNIQNVDPILGDSDYQFIDTFSIILANVNRHVILQNLAKWHTLLDSKGVLLLSGLLEADEQDVINKAIGFKHNFTKQLNGWILISLTKSN